MLLQFPVDVQTEQESALVAMEPCAESALAEPGSEGADEDEQGERWEI